MSATVWLVVVLAGGAAWTVNDVRQYRTFCDPLWRVGEEAGTPLTGASR